MSSNKKTKKYSRNVEGLRDALFDELEDLRAGASLPHEADAFANLASKVLDTVETEMKHEAFRLTMEERRQEFQDRKVKQLTYKKPEEYNGFDKENDDESVQDLSEPYRQ